MSLDKIEELSLRLAETPLDPINNFELGIAYHAIGQTAAAVSFYLRCAEFGYETHPRYVYASLIQMAQCFEHQLERNHSVAGALLQAIAYLPSRPEAWFLLARHNERQSIWREAYTFASVGKSLAGLHTTDPLPCTTEYPGKFVFDFEIAVSGWWIGRGDESITLFNNLLAHEKMPKEYVDACLSNLKQIGG